MSKGSRPRPYSVSQAEFGSNFDAIFRKDKRVEEDAKNEDEAFKQIEESMQVRVQEDESKVGQCGCGRSPTGKCIGWHGLTEEAFNERKELYETGKVDLAGREVK